MTEKRFKCVSDYDWWGVGDILNKKLYTDRKEIIDLLNELHEENEQLKKEIMKFKEWEKHVGVVKREDLDRVFKMSIYEIAEAFKYYQKRIKELSE